MSNRVDSSDTIDRLPAGVSAPTTSLGPQSRWKRSSAAHRFFGSRETQLALVIVVIFIAMTIYKPNFASRDNIQFLLLESVVLGLVAIGQTFVILTKGIDLAVAPILGLTAVITGLIASHSGLSIGAAIVLAIVLGVMLGAINGLLVVIARIPPIIATLGTLGLFGGFQFLYTNGDQVSRVPKDFDYFGNGQVLPWISTPVLVLIVVTAAAGACLKWTRFGRNIMAVGNNEHASRVAGVRVRWIIFSTYVISGALAGFAGLVYVAHTAAATAVTGTSDNYHLQSIAAALIGGTLISGGRGKVFGSVLASVFLTLTLTCMVFLGIPAIWNFGGQGLLILAALALEGRERSTVPTGTRGRAK